MIPEITISFSNNRKSLLMALLSIFCVSLIHMLNYSAALKQNVFREVPSLSGRTCEGDGLLFELYGITKIKCGLTCEDDARCSGFTFRRSNGQCSLCQSGNGAVWAMATETKYYMPNRKWGNTCSPELPCTELNQQCLDGLCVCTPGYSFLNVTWSCVSGCASYGDTFQKYPGQRLAGNNEYVLYVITLDECLNACRSETVCVSVDFSITRCNIQSITALDQPFAYSNSLLFDYYNRNCS